MMEWERDEIIKNTRSKRGSKDTTKGKLESRLGFPSIGPKADWALGTEN